MSPNYRPTTVSDLLDLQGKELGVTEWRSITQADVNGFANLTGDHQWIHVDPSRAQAGPFSGTIAHGLFTLGLGPAMMEELMAFDGFTHSLNYGYDKVRFPAPMPVGRQVRMRATVTGVTNLGNSANITIRQEFEAESVDKPVCVALQVARFTE